MKNLLNAGLISIRKESYLNLLIIIAPLLNFLVGLNIDLYTPSLPAIAQFYDVSTELVKSTITVSMIGFALGCILFGTLIDLFGRRRIILFGLTIYIISSFFALFCQNINELMLIRLIQGMMVSSASVGPRALLVDNFSGHRLTTGMMYTSIAYGLGPIIAPYIGGILQYHFGWQANFAAYTLFGLCLLIIFFLYVDESFFEQQYASYKNILANYFKVLSNTYFLFGIFIVAGISMEQLIYPTLAPFLVEVKLQQSPVIYGNSALIVGLGYFLGTLINRFYIKRFSARNLTTFGFCLMIGGILLQLVFSITAQLNLHTLVLPFFIILLGTGFIFANILACCLKMFPQNAGIAAAIFTSLIIMIAAFGIYLIGQIHVNSSMQLAIIFSTIIIVQLIIFFTNFREIMY